MLIIKQLKLHIPPKTDNARLQSLIYKTSTFLMGCLQIKCSSIHQRVKHTNIHNISKNSSEIALNLG